MKLFLRFLSLYAAIVALVLIFYANLSSEHSRRLDFTKSELGGVEYLKTIYQVAVDASIYQGFLELGTSEDSLKEAKGLLLSNIEKIYSMQKKNSKFFNPQFNKHLENIKNSDFNAEANYQFFEYINHENYRIGDVSKLLFEEDRETFFLSSLITHYMPEYLISVLINHNIAEEFNHKGRISDFKMNQYLERDKLMRLSSQELQNIIKLLQPYEDDKKLTYLINEIADKVVNLPKRGDASQDIVNVKKYLEISHEILKLTYELNDEHINLLESKLKNREIQLQNILFRDTSLLIFILLSIAIIIFYYYRSFASNIKKDIEIKKTNKILDTLILFSKTDIDGKITYMSSALEKLNGYAHEELFGKTHSIMTHEDAERDVFHDLWKTIKAKKTWEGELYNKSKDGDAYWLKSTIIPELDSDGEITGFISYSQNITNQKKLEQEKIKTLKALEFKSQFLSNMSHEIRTPLNGVIGLTNIILKTGLNEKQIDLVSKMQSAANILLGVINDILDISKIEAGKMTIEKSVFNIKESIGYTTDMLLFKAQEKNIDLDVIYENMPTDYFIGDSLRISQVLTNLINNAIKFTKKGGVQLHIELIAPNRMKFKVIDSGIGLKPEQIKTLFDEFTQADMSTSREYGGTGLGLPICKALVEMMGGVISVTSEYGKGSTFSFELPLVEVQNEEEKGQENEAANAEIDVNSPEYRVNSILGKKILIAEDNKMNQMVVSMILDDSQIDIDFALDGQIAVEKAAKNNYDLIFMDIQMPNMNGYDATKTIRLTNREIPIVALSANVMKEDIKLALESGMNETLAKPIEVAKLYSVLLKYLN